MLWLAVAFLAAACSDGGAVEPDPLRNGADYLWNKRGGTLAFTTLRGERNYLHRLTISRGGSIDDLVTDEYSRPVSRSLWHFNQTDGTINDCDSSTLWCLPYRYRQFTQAVYAPGPIIRSSSILCLDDSNVIVGTESDGLFHYSAVRGEWYSLSLPSRSTVTALGMDTRPGNSRLFAGTVSDGIHMKHRFDAVWSQLPAPSGMVQDLEVSDTTTLFAVIDNVLWFSLNPFTQWMYIPLGSSAGLIQSIALLRISDDEEILFVATSKSGLLYIRLVDSFPTLVSYYNTRGFQSIRNITTMQDAPYPAVGIAPPSTLFIAPSFGLWIPVSLQVTQLNCLAQSALSGVVLIGTNEGIYQYNGVISASISLQGQNVSTLTTTQDNTFYAGTDGGVYRSRSEGASWTRIDGGMVLTAVRKPWVLLPPTFESGTCWEATTILDDADNQRTITGRVLSVLDELVLPSGHERYKDAVVVRYTFETSAGSLEQEPYVWLAYFVRGKGLVWLEESAAGEVVATSMLIP
ncbi:MAG: hypothetical protein WC824_00780 [Bacteroidota bacterium]